MQATCAEGGAAHNLGIVEALTVVVVGVAGTYEEGEVLVEEKEIVGGAEGGLGITIACIGFSAD